MERNAAFQWRLKSALHRCSAYSYDISSVVMKSRLFQLVIPWICLIFSKTYLSFQSGLNARQFTCFSGNVEKWKKQNTTFETFPQQNKKTNVQPISTYLRKKLMRRNACHGARVLGLFFGCGCHTTAHLGHRWWPWLSYKLQGTELINSWDRNFVCMYRFV